MYCSSLFNLIYRFDIYGLSADANEDESGIIRASENSTPIYLFADFYSVAKTAQSLPFCFMCAGFTSESDYGVLSCVVL